MLAHNGHRATVFYGANTACEMQAALLRLRPRKKAAYRSSPQP
jgi:hypothetical protein